MDLTDADIERFWSKVDRRGPDECWPWLGGRRKRTPAGDYGGFKIAQVFELAPRVSFFIANGYLPPVVRHSCDNPPCVNPAHLLPGTQLENARDRAERDRAGGKLRNAQVEEILRSPDSGRTLARRFGVSPATISMIRTRKTWRHLGPVT